MLRKTLLTLFAAALALAAEAAGSGEKLLDQVVAWCSEKPTIAVDYKITSGGETLTGNMIVEGKRFRVKSAMIDSWFDGKTQWTYSPSTNETSISEPTDEEIQQINPFAIINAFRDAYNAQLAPGAASDRFRRIILTPKDRHADITRVELSIPKEASYPSRIVVKLASGEVCVLNMSRFIRGASYPPSTFVYDPSAYPGAQTVDLR